MQQKWKCIISNWINCYFYDNNNKHEPLVNQELLLNIINHLRQNFNLDESKSSIFSGQTLEEFITEKFPGFMFENGTLEVVTEDDIFIAASLLLFFVCVNSKDVNIKSAMCSKLSASDQEVILKFSKTLMECSKISSLDVVAAIKEACGPDMATGEGSGRSLVAETPPALRSLHGEVRRLQAALDAERFDRNYLQDELARTNLKLEKLVKDKEQYKIDIVNLKAKISMCCGQEAEAQGGETENSDTSKLTKQLQQMEQRLVDVQEELDEVKHERDTLKTKLDDLKCECDRLILLNINESSQATQLAEELENERRLSQSLRELVAELRQHNQRNGLDASMLECDDPDTSVHSLQRSFSVCNEVCANVVEVQLGEERAKIEALKQQIHILQDECNEQQQNINTFKKIISDKENEIFGLKHRINEEIEDKNNLKCFLDNEITKLNNVVNELEQKLKSQSEQCKMINEKHAHEVRTLHEEKMSLIQNLSDQARMSDNQIKELKEELDTEKSSKINMRDDYENHVMKLKEKVLNRNNELVELQNKILQKGEAIEQLSLELRKEKELNTAKIKELTKDLAVMNEQKVEIEKDLQDKCMEITKLIEEIHKRDVSIENLIKDLDAFKTTAANLKEECRVLEENKKFLIEDVQNRQVSADKMRKELDNLKQLHVEEKDKLQCKVDEMSAMVKSLQTQLQNEIDFKIGLQHELEKTQSVITKLSNTNTKLNTELTETITIMQAKEEIIKTNDLSLQEERAKCMNLKKEFEELTLNMEKLTNELLQKSQIIMEFEKLNESLQEVIAENNEQIGRLHTELANVNDEKLRLETFVESSRREKDAIINEKDILLLKEKEEHEVLKKELDSLQTFVESLKTQKDEIVKEKDLLLCKEKNRHEVLKNECDNLHTFVESLKNEKEEIIKEKDLIFHNIKVEHEELNKEYEKLQTFVQSLKDENDKKLQEKDLLLNEIKEGYDVLKKGYDTLQTTFESLKNERVKIVKEKDLLLHEERERYEVLKNECDNLEIVIESLKDEKDKIIKEKDLLLHNEEEARGILKNEYASLQTFVESLKNEKDKVIEEKNLLLKKVKEEYEVLKNDYECVKINLKKLTSESILKDKTITECNMNLEQLHTCYRNEATKYNDIIELLNKDLRKVKAEKQSLEERIKSLTNEKNEIITEKEKMLRKEQDIYNKLKQDDENIKKDLVKVSNELTIKDAMLKEYEEKLTNLNNYRQEEITKYSEKIDALNQELIIVNAQKQNLQDSIQLITKEKDSVIKESDIILQAEKEICRKLKEDYDKLNKDMEQLSIDAKEKDTVIQKCENELRHLNKCLQDEIHKNKEIVTSINTDLTSVNVEKENLHKTIITLTEEKNNLIKIVNEKTNFISELESERESLSRKMEEKGATIHGLEQKLQDKMLRFMEIENNFGIEISKLMTKLSDAEKTFIDIKAKSNTIIENQESQIQSLNGDIFTLKGKLEGSIKEIGKLEKNLKEINAKYDKAQKDCQNLEATNSMLRNDIALKELHTYELNNKNILLSSLIAEREKELSIVWDSNNEWKCKKDLIDDNTKKENERLRQAMQELKIEKEEELAEKECNITELKKEIIANNNEKATLEKEKSLYKALLVELEKEKDNLISKNGKLESEKEELLKDRSNLETNLLKLKTNFDELKKHLVTLEEEKIELINKLERTKSDLNKLEEEYQKELEIKEEMSEMLKKRTDLLDDYKVLQEKNNNNLLELKDKEAEIKSLKEEISNNNDRICELEESCNRKEISIAELKQEKEKLEVEKYDLIEEKDRILSKITDIENKKLVLENEVMPKLKEENLRLTKQVDEDKTVITNLEKQMQKKFEENDKLCQNYEAEKVVLTNKCQILEDNLKQTEMELSKRNSELSELRKELEISISESKQRETELQENHKTLVEQSEEKDMRICKLIQDLEEEKATMSRCEQELQRKEIRILELKQRLNMAETENRELVQNEKLQFTEILRKKDEECDSLRKENNEWKIKLDSLEVEFNTEKNALENELQTQVNNNEKLVKDLEVTIQESKQLTDKLQISNNEMMELKKEINDIKTENDKIVSENNLLIQENNNNIEKLSDLQKEFVALQNELTQIREYNMQVKNIVATYESEIITLENIIHKEMKQNDNLFKENVVKLDIIDKCKILQEFNEKIEQVLEQRRTEINALKEEIKIVTSEAKAHEIELKQKNEMLTKALEEKDDVILKINEELTKEKVLNNEYQKQVQLHENDIGLLEKKLSQLRDDVDRNNLEVKTNEGDRIEKCEELYGEALQRGRDSQVHTTSSDITHSATEKNKIISDLERILNDKNRTISNLNSDITYLKSMMAESEIEVLDKNKELEISRENCQQLSLQLKKIVHQKNDEIMDLKKQITKMSLTENRASQIVKVSAKYQEIIQKRIAEIKSDTALKELTNFGNAANGDLKRSLNSGSITMEDLENFLETTDKHLRRCAERRAALQKERDRLLEVNRINESDVINIKKFLTELSVSVKTFNSYKEMYSQKLSRVILLQRTVRREILKVEERLSEEARCRLERTYAAVMQDLVECVLNLERWVERCVARAVSSDKMKQAFMSDLDRASLPAASYQSPALEAQIDELETSFQKVLEEVARALKGGAGPRGGGGGGGTVAEVRAEYEDKLTRMKTKMKELYSQEMEVFKERQRREVAALERELAETRARLADSSSAYEEHIRGLSSELWRLGERLVERGDDRPRALRAPSLLSLQQSGALAEDQGRASDTHSLRSLPVNINKKKEGRGLHMSDEEGEVFDNRYLRELRSPGEAAGAGVGVGRASELATPRARGDPSLRLSELRWRNSLCLPHLKSSYPAETQFVAAHEDDIKAVPANASVGGRQQRKEVGITAYKKPGPPTPSKQAGRLSATDCELRESLRVEAEPGGAGGGAQTGRRTATPSRLRALFTSNRNDAVDGTPRSRRLSNFFRKK